MSVENSAEASQAAFGTNLRPASNRVYENSTAKQSPQYEYVILSIFMLTNTGKSGIIKLSNSHLSVKELCNLISRRK